MVDPDEMEHHFDKIDAVLEEFGGFWKTVDLLEAIEDGTMQSFAKGGTWVVTQVHVFPRKKVVDIVLVYGTMAEAQELEATVEDFARSIGATTLFATGRWGWTKLMHGGWKRLNANYIKEL